ncbi:MAG TPA: zinc ribbon domain-containing protein [Candidatus Limnocylindria bacterium]|nr:zinc ribbon domain-containing protein [Candidatus Limnocylindria bacterium]
MTGESLECFNCGRSNPPWAQVCRNCGAPLRPGHTATVPSGPIPTDRDSLISMLAALAAIAGAVLLGAFLANANPSGIAGQSPLPSLIGSPDLSLVPQPTGSVPAVPTATPAATPAPTPPPPGTVAFGHGLDGQLMIVEPDDVFTPGETFAHAVTMQEPFGVPQIAEQVVRLREGADPEEVQPAEGNTLGVDPNSAQAGFICCDAVQLLEAWGAGQYELRVLREGEVIAVGRFELAEG